VRILILGGDGMLGHQLLQSWQGHHTVRVTLRQPMEVYRKYGLFDRANSYFGINVRALDAIERAMDDFRPDAVVNAVGIVKQRQEAKDAIISIEINALLPHRLSMLCADRGARLVHLSTDCVFSGRKGGYTESDEPDALDLYGRSKLLGEVHDAHAVTLRTSIIGLELSRKKSLIEWFLAQRGEVRGFTRAIYTGFTTLEMARVIEKILCEHPTLHGVWQVASEPVDKYTLLEMLQQRLADGRRRLVKDDGFACDRSLVGQHFNEAVGYQPPAWSVMLDELAVQIRQRGS